MERYNPDILHRKSIRLKGYDYSQAGEYFITLCCYDRQCLFGHIQNGEMTLNQFGQIARDEWIKSAQIRSEIKLHQFVVMPNHIHGIVEIKNGARGRGDRLVAQKSITIGNDNILEGDDGVLEGDDGLLKGEGGLLKGEGELLKGDGELLEGDYKLLKGDRPVVPTGVRSKGLCPKSIGAMVAGYKSSVTTQLNTLRNSPGQHVWQRNFYDNIIHDDKSFLNIKNYILSNPANWLNDRFYNHES
jgi:putative transposase